jgi:hypothetical protein
MRLLPCLAAFLLLPACASVESTAEGDLSGTTYYEMTTRLTSTDLARWNADLAGLQKSFDNICGDTFCSGDYSNLTTVSINCSITQANYVKECTWVLGGSIEYVDGATGAFTVDARMFPCTIPVKAKVGAFLDALDEGTDQVRLPLPTTGTSFYDGIGSCLSGVVGNPPPASTGTTYEELADYFNENPDPLFWFGVRRRLNDAFAASCATTFCQESWKNIAGLRFVCATNASTGQVVGCLWDFGADNVSVTSKGHVSAKTKILKCPVSVKGAAVDVEAALAGSDPLHATLPGSTANLATQLDACL